MRVVIEVVDNSSEDSEETLKVILVEPPDFVESSPELASFIDVNLARLLCVCLPELLSDPQRIDASLEDPSFATEVGRTTQAKCARKVKFRLVKYVAIWIVGKIEDVIAGPVCFQHLRNTLGKCRCGRCIVWESIVVHILALRPRYPIRCF